MIARYIKSIAGLAGGVTPAALITAANEYLGWDVPAAVAAVIVAALGALATAVAPANEGPVEMPNQPLIEDPGLDPLYLEDVEGYGKHAA